MANVKQVIVVRKDLKMPKGKIAAQVAHAAMAVFLNMMDQSDGEDADSDQWSFEVKRGSAMEQWLTGSFTKPVLACSSEAELLELYQKAQDAGLPCSLITDNGLTVFNGVKTNTCIAIGPDYDSNINPITGHLPLL